MVLSRRVTVAVAAMAAAAAAIVPARAASAAGSGAAPGAGLGWRTYFTNACSASLGCAYDAVSASGQQNAWAAGYAGFNGSEGSGRPVAARWLGGAWHASHLPGGLAGQLFAISTDSARDTWAVSLDGGYVLHWNGSRWSVARRWAEGGLPRQLTGVTAFSPHDVWVFGGPGADPGLGTWHYNGTTWTHVTTKPGAGVVSASALSPTDIWATGSVNSGSDSIVHYTGTWHQVHASALAGLQFSGITATSPGSVWAAATVGGNPAAAYIVRLHAGRWTKTKLPWPVNPGDLAGDGHGGVWLTAETSAGAWIIHGSASGHWTRQALGTHRGLTGLTLIPGTAALWGAGAVNASGAHAEAIWADGKVR